jgi:hypothetical protein
MSPRRVAYFSGRDGSCQVQEQQVLPLRFAQGQDDNLDLLTRRRARLIAKVTTLLATFVSALREIFDESAYARFLTRNRITSSRAAYAAFLREHDVAKARRPKCC